jgi:asparagine synthase (glutamine-hydrolysing)
MGIKPLYYCRDNGRVIFASEIKAILCAVDARPNQLALNAIMTGDALWDPQTLFDGIHAVLPGEMIRFDADGKQTSQRYFRLADEINEHEYRGLGRLSLEEVSQHLEAALRYSVGIHKISDVPVAVLASGGLDSSLIAVLSSDDQPIPLYHANVVGPASELDAARALSRVIGAQLHVADLTPRRYAADMAEVTYHHETPSAYHPNDLPFHLICRLARDHGVKVLLTGEGADELFLGYPWMIVSDTRRRVQQTAGQWSRRLAWLPGVNGLFKAVGKLSGNGSAELLAAEEYVARQHAETAYSFIEHPAERQAAVDSFDSCGAHLRSLLYRNDRMGMMESLESRIPFLENNLIRMAVNLPAKHKLRSSALGFLARHPYSSNKLALRQVARRLMPKSLADRRKLGFPVDARSYFDIQSSFFAGGFLADHYKLTPDQLAATLAQAGADQVWRFFAAEVFARIFYLGQDRANVAARVAACAVDAGAATSAS